MGLERTGLQLVLQGAQPFIAGARRAQQATDRLHASFQRLTSRSASAGLRHLKIGDVVPPAALDRLKGLNDQFDQLGLIVGRVSPQVGGAIHLFSGLTGELGKVAGAMSLTTMAAVALGAALVGLGLRGAAMTGVVQAFDALTASAGTTANVLLQDLREAARGTVADMTLMRQANVALAGAGPELAKALAADGGLAGLLEIARAQARATGESVDHLFQSLVTGIKRSSPLLIDNTGLVLKVGEANEAYAKAIGKAVDQLTAEEQQIALLNATLEAGRVGIEQYGKSALQASEYMARIQTTITNTLDRLALAVQPIFTLFLAIADTILSAIVWPIQHVVIPIFYELANTIFGPLLTSFNLFKSAVGDLVAPVLRVIHRWVVLVVGVFRTLGRAFQWIAEQAATLFAPIKDIVIKYIVEPFTKLLDPTTFAKAAGNVFGAYAYGILWAANTLIYPAVIAIAEFIADFLMGFSPAKKGPLSKIDVGAANLMRTWLEAFTGVPLTPVESMMGRVNTLLGDIALLTHEQVTTLLAQLDAQLQPYLDHLAVARALAESVLEPLRQAEDAMQKRLDSALKRFTQGGLDAEAVRALDRQNEALARQKELWEGVTAEAEYQLALKQSEQAVLRAMLAVQQRRTQPEEQMADSAEQAAKAVKEAAGGGAADMEPAVGGGGAAFPDLSSSVGNLLGVTDDEIQALFGEMGAAFTEGFMLPGMEGQMNKLVVNQMKLSTQMKRITGSDAFQGLRSAFEGVFGDGEDSLKTKIQDFVDTFEEKWNGLFGEEGSVRQTWDGFKSSITEKWNELFGEGGTFDSLSLDAVTGLFNTVFGGKDVDGSIMQKVASTKDDIQTVFEKDLPAIFDQFSLDTLFNTFERILGLQPGSIRDTLDAFATKVDDIFKNAPGGILHDVVADVGAFLTTFIKDPAVNVANWFIEAFESMVNNVIDGINWLVEQYNKGAGALWDRLKIDPLDKKYFGRVGVDPLDSGDRGIPGAASGGLFGPGLLKVHAGEVLAASHAQRLAVFPRRWVDAMDRMAHMVPYRAASAPAPVVNVQSAGGGTTHNTFNVHSQQSMRLAMARARAFDA